MKPSTLALVVLSSLAALPAAAQSSDADAARARELFSQGVSVAGEHRYADAAALFRQALALRDAPTIRYNLASTLFEEQQYTEAHELATALLALTDLPDSVRTPTEALEQQIANAAALVTFVLPDGVTGEVQVDDVPVANPSVTTALAPGHHVARAIANGSTVAEWDFDVIAAEHRAVTLVGAGAAEPAATAGSHPITDEWWFWAIVGGGAAVVIGVSIGIGIAVDQGNHAPVTGNFTPGIISW
jgi:hypothetical protein